MLHRSLGRTAEREVEFSILGCFLEEMEGYAGDMLAWTLLEVIMTVRPQS